MNFSKRENTNRRLLNVGINEKIYSKVWIYTLRIACVGFLAACFALAGVALGTFMGLMDGVPDVSLDALAINGETSRIVDQDGNLITEIYTAEQRTSVSIDEMPQDLINALVAIEDHNFFEHDGIDLEGILRAGVSVVKAGGDTVEGGSTITQQMIKKLVLTSDQNLRRKIQEWYLALRLEDMMGEVYGKERTKELILESYLNYNFLGNNCYGVETASERYFGKPVSKLTTAECAVLAGLFNAPSAYDPIANYDGVSRERQLQVLDAMKQYGYLTESQYETAKGEQVFVTVRAVNAKYNNNDDDDVYSYFEDYVIEQVQLDLVNKLGYSKSDAYNMLYHGGLTIYITMDPRIQGILDDVYASEEYFQDDVYYECNYALTLYDEKDRNITDDYGFVALFDTEEEAEIAVNEYRSRYVDFTMERGVDYVENTVITEEPQYSMTVIDQHTGYIMGMAGGRGKKTTNLSLNRATDSVRQPGSTFKILACYAAALDVGGFCCGSVQDDSYFCWDGWQIDNWWGTGYFLGFRTMREGVADSENIVTTRFMREVGVETNFDYVESFGITTLRREPDEWGLTDMVGSLCLGSGSVKNIELCGAYAAIANGGVYNKPTAYTHILDSNGNVFFENIPESHRVIKETTAYLLTDMMRDVVTGANGGSATACNFDYDMFIAGKTGTTTDANDYAFVGFTPYYTCAVQAGFDYISYPEIYFDDLGYTSRDPNGEYLLNSQAHRYLWGKVMGDIHEPLEDIDYVEMPDGITYVSLCKDSGLYPNEYCSQDPRGSRVSTDLACVDNLPSGTCDRHIRLHVCKESGQIATSFCTAVEYQVFLTRTEDEISEIGVSNLKKIKDYDVCAYPYKYSSTLNSGSVTTYDGYTPTYCNECTKHTSTKKEEPKENSKTDSGGGGTSPVILP